MESGAGSPPEGSNGTSFQARTLASSRSLTSGRWPSGSIGVSPLDEEVQSWAEAVRECYADAMAWLKAHPQAALAEREALYVELTSRTHALGLEYAKVY